MAFMVAFTPMAAGAVDNVKENTQNEIEEYGVDTKDAPNADKGKYHDAEGAKVHDGDATIKDMEKKVDDAKGAVEEMQRQLDEIKDVDAEGTKKTVEEGTKLVEGAEKEAEGAEDAKKEAEQLKTDIKEHNEGVEEEQKKIDDTAEEIDKKLDVEAINKKADEAAEKAKEAKEKLDAALNENEKNATVEKAVEDSVQAAKDAEEAAKAAKKMKEDAEKELLEIANAYNEYAKANGLKLIDVEKCELSEVADALEELTKRKTAIAGTELTDKTIKEAVTNLEKADKAVKETAKVAEDSANAAKKAVDKLAEVEGISKAIHAEYLEKDMKAKEGYETAIKENSAKLNDAKKSRDEAKTAYDNAKNSAANKWEDMSTWAQFKWVLKNLGENVKPKNLFKFKDTYIKMNTQNEKNAYNAWNSKVGEITSQINSDTVALNKTNDTIAAKEKIANAITKDATDLLVTLLEGRISKDGEAINQMEFDKDLNKWAQSYKDFYKFWNWDDKAHAVAGLSDKYRDNSTFWNWVKNGADAYAIGIRLFISGKDINKKIASGVEITKEDIKEAYKQRAIVLEALQAIEAGTKGAEAKKELKSLTEKISALNDMQNEVTAASGKVSAAKTKYETMEAQFKELKEEIANTDIQGAKYDKLVESLKNLKEKLGKAKDAVEKAEKEQEIAKRYADWAQELLEEHVTNAYGQLALEGQPEIDGIALSNKQGYDKEIVESRDVAKFTGNIAYDVELETSSVKIPYTLYKEYVKAVYEQFTVAEVKDKNNAEVNGKGANLDKSIVYWEYKDGKLTGNYITDPNKLVAGQTYFVGYVLKVDGSGDEHVYHIDGYLYKKTEPINPPIVDPDPPIVDPNPPIVDPNPPVVNPDPPTENIPDEEPPLDEQPDVEIEDEETPLDEQPDVEIEDDETPLDDKPQADIPDEKTPLSDNPLTGDSLPIAWIGLALLGILGCGGIAFAGKKKEK
jgi:myosin heavy subunit